jgi:ABC-2 type transport system permease protein
VSVFTSTLRKLVRRPATWIVGIILVVILALFYLAIGASATMSDAQGPQARAQILATLQGDTAYRVLLAFVAGLGGLLAVAYAAAVGGSEWSWGTLRTAVARGESRSLYALATFAAVALVACIGFLLAFAVGLVLVPIAASLAGLTPPSPSADLVASLPELFAKSLFGLIEQAAIGYMVAMLARSQLAGVGAGIALYFVEQFAGIFVPDIVKYMPFTVSGSLIITPEQAQLAGATILEATAAAALTGIYLLAAVVIAAIVTEAREIAN